MNNITDCYIRNGLDGEGHPTGGEVSGVGISIYWQNGPLSRHTPDEGPPACNCSGRAKPNGAFVETIIAACVQRLEFYNESSFRCRENSLAITHLEEALHWLDARTADRRERGVEGTHTV